MDQIPDGQVFGAHKNLHVRENGFDEPREEKQPKQSHEQAGHDSRAEAQRLSAYEQNTQQSPGLGRTVCRQPGHT